MAARGDGVGRHSVAMRASSWPVRRPTRRPASSVSVPPAGACTAALVTGCVLLTGCQGVGDYPAPYHQWDPPVPGDAVRATVATVIDGDTLIVRTSRSRERVRLIGVDAPEVTGQRACYGERASAALRRIAGPGTVVLLQSDRERRDRYGRSLRYVWTADGTFVNAALIRGGHAQAMAVAPNERHVAVFRAAEARARRAGRGLWARCGSWPSRAGAGRGE